MGMTLTQKILAAHAGLPEVKAGQLIQAKLDLVLANDITGPVAINEFEKAGFSETDKNARITLVMDHFAPNKDIKSAESWITRYATTAMLDTNATPGKAGQRLAAFTRNFVRPPACPSSLMAIPLNENVANNTGAPIICKTHCFYKFYLFN